MCNYCEALMSEEKHEEEVNSLAQKKLIHAMNYLVYREDGLRWLRPDSPTRSAGILLYNALRRVRGDEF